MGQNETHIPKYRGPVAKLLLRACVAFCVTIVTNLLWGGQVRTDFDVFIEILNERYGAKAQVRGIAWRDHLSGLDSANVQDQLASVNKFFNQRVRWRTDSEIYGVEDFWATPAETLGRGTGDCEDFTIAKYVSLRQLGVPSDQLRLTYVKLQMIGGRSQAHMVLAWYETPGSIPLILDNANAQILPASQRRDLRPVFSFTSDALWIAGNRQNENINPSSRLSQWRQMLNRAQAEGITL